MNINDFESTIKYLKVMKREAEDRLEFFKNLSFTCKKEIEVLNKNIAHFENILMQRISNSVRY